MAIVPRRTNRGFAMIWPQDKFAALIRADQQKWDKVVKAAGIHMD